MLIELSYAAYLTASIGMTVWVARTLSSNGEIFLVDCFGHDEKLARSTNHLLVTGFYLVNIGFILLALQLGTEPATGPEAIRFIATKVGLAVLVLGLWHFFNMHLIAKFGRKVGRWLREAAVLNG
ncbi:hypothetical protein [Alteraurantiacibacter buctensis]|uniref:Uncharacterized protein n=1 Tax=Alteraurantiacibacter buctensis TaxID=1503981 RepID=A0A844YUR5_9SPHN|nr:hypothetical protein [Alteraurantiacibacter buctensis]MXO70862.1 hypothetical protein [Alteraurantiacibacter buctensis]